MSIYYVDTASSGGDGTTTATSGANAAWATIASVNAASFSAGDSILFKRGCTWREQLTVPSSGSAGNVITIGAYGTGVDPIINGGNLITTWTQIPDSSSGADLSDNFDDNNISDWSVTGGAAVVCQNGRVEVTSSAGGGQYATIAATSRTESWASFDMTFATLGVSAGAYVAGTGIRKNSNGTICIAMGWTKTGSVYHWSPAYQTDATTVYYTSLTARTITTGVAYHVLLHFKAATGAGTNDGICQWWVDGQLIYSLSNVDSDTITALGAEVGDRWDNSSGSDVFYVDNFKLGTTKTNLNVWGASCGSQAWYVTCDTNKGTKVSSPMLCVANYNWYWDSVDGNLYLYAASSPDTLYTTTGVQADVRAFCIDTNAKNYLTIGNIQVDGAVYNGIDLDAGTGLTLNSISGKYNGCGICVSGTASVTANTCAIHDGYDSNYYCQGGAAVFNNCTSYNADNDGFSSTGAGNATYNFCLSYNNGRTGQGIVGPGDGFTGHNTTTNTLRYCIAYGNIKSGLACIGDSAGTIYNCSFYNNATYGIYVENTSGAWVIKNNITQGHTYEIYIKGTLTSLASDYNCFYDSLGGTAFYYLTTAYNFANWKTNSSQDAHSLNSDPKFTSTATPDFSLQSASPCRNAGVSVGLTTDYAGHTVPFAVGGTPDIGAYEYQFYDGPIIGGGSIKMGLGLGLS